MLVYRLHVAFLITILTLPTLTPLSPTVSLPEYTDSFLSRVCLQRLPDQRRIATCLANLANEAVRCSTGA